MEAGLEHLSWAGGTLRHVDMLLIVVQPTMKVLLTAARTHKLAVVPDDEAVREADRLGRCVLDTAPGSACATAVEQLAHEDRFGQRHSCPAQSLRGAMARDGGPLSR